MSTMCDISTDSSLERQNNEDNDETIFPDKYHTVYFSPSSTAIEHQKGAIFIGDIKVCLSILESFGRWIKTIHLEFDDDKLLCHLNEYCADSLVELNISRHTNENIGDVGAFKKPFSRLEVLQFKNSTLNEQLKNIQKWFPQIRHLKFLNQTKLTDCEFLMKSFSRLEHLTIDFKAIVSHRTDRDRDLFDSKSVTAALRLNPQLRSVEFYHVDTGFVRNVSKHLEFLEDIHIKWNKRYSDQNLHEMRFKRSVRELQVNFNFEDIETQSIPLSFSDLKTLTLEASELNDHLRKFIRKHPTITKLTLSFHEWEREIELLPLFKTLPSMVEFNMNGTMCYVEEVIYLLGKYNAMNKLRFRILDSSKYNGTRLLLTKWHVDIDDMNYVQLKRRNNDAE